VADEDDGQALGHHLAQRIEQRFAFLRRQHGRGLVEDEDARAAVQRLEDFDALALADRKAADPGLGRDRQAEALRDVEQFGARGAAAREGLPQRFAAHHHVVEHAEVVGQREMLVHHADAGLERRARVAGRQRLAEDFDAAFVGGVVAEEDGDQRGLAGAVLAEQREDLAGVQFERDRVVGDEGAEALGDAGEAKDRAVVTVLLLPPLGEGWDGGPRRWMLRRAYLESAGPHPSPLPEGEGVKRGRGGKTFFMVSRRLKTPAAPWPSCRRRCS
jgi:hypothetical protein